jgi:arylsulfatase A-like enzyme
MIKRPGANVPTVVNSVVSTIDLFPTMLDFTQVKYDYDGPAISALKTDLLEGRQGVMSEISRRYQQKAYIAQDRTKLIMGSKPIVTAQKASDQNEVTGDPTAIVGLFSAAQDLPVTDSARASSLALFLNETHQLALSKLVEQSTSRAKVKDTTLEQLKSLGYLQ